jgi:outer membrane scaffolding protein for murein synthesis (MipA/OmpV family)
MFPRPASPPRLAALLCLAAAWGAPAAAQAPEQPGLTPATGILDAPDPDVVMTLRAGVEVSPSYFGSDDYEFGPDAAFRIDYFRLPGGLEIGSTRSVGFRTGWGLSGSARYISNRNSGDHAEIEGLDNVDWSFEAGLGVGYEQRNWRVFTDVRYGFVGHNAWVGEIGADGIAYPIEGLTLTLGPRLEFGDNKFASTYFGVSEEESVRSGLDRFDAEGGLLGAGLELGAQYRFSEKWGVEGAATWGRLLNDAADSPVTAQGSEDQYGVRFGVTRRISLDF